MVVACMDSRMDIFEMLGLRLRRGAHHPQRRRGGSPTTSPARCAISQRFLGTREIVLLHHTDCGLQSGRARTSSSAELETRSGVKPAWALESFNDPFLDTEQSIRRIRMSPFVLHKDDVRGFVYDVDTGQLHEVQP